MTAEVENDDDLPVLAVSRARVREGEVGRYEYVRERFDHTRKLMASGLTPRQVAVTLRRELGVSRRTADRYVAAVLQRMVEDAGAEPFESKRARIVAMLHESIHKARTLKRTYERDGQVHEYDAPDLRAINQALALLAQIEGVTGRN